MSSLMRKVLNVPFIRDETKYGCSEASFRMLCSYYNINIENKDLLEKDCYAFETLDACFPKLLKCYKKKNGKLKDIIHLIESEKPVLVRVKPYNQEELHSFIIYGFDIKIKIFMYHESQRDPKQYISFENFKNIWTKKYIYCEYRWYKLKKQKKVKIVVMK